MFCLSNSEDDISSRWLGYMDDIPMEVDRLPMYIRPIDRMLNRHYQTHEDEHQGLPGGHMHLRPVLGTHATELGNVFYDGTGFSPGYDADFLECRWITLSWRVRTRSLLQRLRHALYG